MGSTPAVRSRTSERQLLANPAALATGSAGPLTGECGLSLVACVSLPFSQPDLEIEHACEASHATSGTRLHTAPRSSRRKRSTVPRIINHCRIMFRRSVRGLFRPKNIHDYTASSASCTKKQHQPRLTARRANWKSQKAPDRVGHQRVQRCPDPSERPVRRVEGGLREVPTPGSGIGICGSPHPADDLRHAD